MTRRHLAALALAYAVFCALYLGASLTGLREPLVLTPSAVDARIPFVGWSIWVYLSQFPLLAFVFWKAADSPAWGRSLRSMLVATLLSVAVFVALPTRLDRAPIDGSAATSVAFAALYLFDPPSNCFPSLHVSLALLGALAFWPERRRLTAGCLAWATLIAASTLTTRQHVLVDVAGGAVVALVAHWLVSVSRIGRRAHGNLLVVRVGRESAALQGVLVKYLFGHRVRRSSQPRGVGVDGSCRRRGVRSELARDRDDLVGLETYANDNSDADIGATPPTASTPELHPDPEIFVSHPSRRRLTAG